MFGQILIIYEVFDQMACLEACLEMEVINQ